MRLKGELINGAYSQARISGITKSPTPEELKLALVKLEGMAREYEGRNICVNYNFEDTPDLNSLHNVEEKYWFAFTTNLAVRLLSDFGKDPIPALKTDQIASFSFLSASTAPIRQTRYPNRQPMGSGNDLRYSKTQRYYRPQPEAPLSCTTNTMFIGDIDNFTEHFDAYLNDGETISSYVLTNDNGLTITNDTNATPDITYTVEADGNNEEQSNSLLQVKIVVTTSDGRIATRIINFKLISTDVG